MEREACPTAPGNGPLRNSIRIETRHENNALPNAANSDAGPPRAITVHDAMPERTPRDGGDGHHGREGPHRHRHVVKHHLIAENRAEGVVRAVVGEGMGNVVEGGVALS